MEAGLGRGRTYPARHARHLLNPARRLLQPPRRTIGRMDLSPNHSVLELGCGPGWFSPTLADAVRDGSLILCDIQHEMLAHAVTRTGARRWVHAVQSDATTLPFPAGVFDRVLLSSMLGETPAPSECLREVERVLASSGRVTVIESRRDSDFLAIPELETLARRAGLRIVARAGLRLEYTATLAR